MPTNPQGTGIAAIYSIIANIHYYSIATPLKQLVTSNANLVRHCTGIYGLLAKTQTWR